MFVTARLLARIRERVPESVLRRVLSAVLLVGTGSVLAIAAWLEPSTAGHGTHTQLGLSSCSILMATGLPCPMCGATTTFSLWAHFRPIAAMVNQPFASLLFWMTAGTFAVSLVEVVDPRGRWEHILGRLAPWEAYLATGFLALMASSWLYKTWLMDLL